MLLAGCGGGGTTQTTKGGSSQAVVDPSGNWTMTATDAQGQHVAFAALFNQVGSTVTANSFTASNDPSAVQLACRFTAVARQRHGAERRSVQRRKSR
jgi:hypothetical protein